MVLPSLGKQYDFQRPFFSGKTGFAVTVSYTQSRKIPEGMQNRHHEQAGKQERQGQDQVVFIIDATDEQQCRYQQIKETVPGGEDKDAPLIQHDLSGRRQTPGQPTFVKVTYRRR